MPKESRAVARLVQPGNHAICVACRDEIKFRAAQRLQQVICNVYEHGNWVRVEHYHPGCYEDRLAPYGPPEEALTPRRRSA